MYGVIAKLNLAVLLSFKCLRVGHIRGNRKFVRKNSPCHGSDKVILRTGMRLQAAAELSLYQFYATGAEDTNAFLTAPSLLSHFHEVVISMSFEGHWGSNMNLCSFCQVCLQKPGQQHNHYPTFPEFVASAESCHLCGLLLESLSGSPRKEIADRVRAGSYSKVTLRFSLENAFVEVITRDRYTKGRVFTVREPEGQFLGYWILPKK
jgi:hypothetical protein